MRCERCASRGRLEIAEGCDIAAPGSNVAVAEMAENKQTQEQNSVRRSEHGALSTGTRSVAAGCINHRAIGGGKTEALRGQRATRLGVPALPRQMAAQRSQRSEDEMKQCLLVPWLRGSFRIGCVEQSGARTLGDKRDVAVGGLGRRGGARQFSCHSGRTR